MRAGGVGHCETRHWNARLLKEHHIQEGAGQDSDDDLIADEPEEVPMVEGEVELTDDEEGVTTDDEDPDVEEWRDENVKDVDERYADLQ